MLTNTDLVAGSWGTIARVGGSGRGSLDDLTNSIGISAEQMFIKLRGE